METSGSMSSSPIAGRQLTGRSAAQTPPCPNDFVTLSVGTSQHDDEDEQQASGIRNKNHRTIQINPALGKRGMNRYGTRITVGCVACSSEKLSKK